MKLKTMTITMILMGLSTPLWAQSGRIDLTKLDKIEDSDLITFNKVGKAIVCEGSGGNVIRTKKWLNETLLKFPGEIEVSSPAIISDYICVTVSRAKSYQSPVEKLEKE